MSYLCISDNCRDQIIDMAYLKNGFVPALDTCRYGLYNCNSVKYRYRQYSEGGVGLAGSAILPDYLFFDTFQGSGLLADHTPEIGSSWSTVGDMIVEDGFAKFNQSVFSGGGMFTNFSMANTVINTRLQFDPDFGSGMSFYFNRIDNENTWGLYHSPPYIWLFKIVGGTGMNVDTSYEGVYGYSMLDVTIEANDDNVKIYRDSELIINYTESNRPHKNASIFGITWFKTQGNLRVDQIAALEIL